MQTPAINAETPSDLAAPEPFTRKQALANDEAQGFRDRESIESLDSHSAPHAGRALQVIEGKQRAAPFLARLHAQQADPDELAVIVSMLYSAVLCGFFRVIEKAPVAQR